MENGFFPLLSHWPHYVYAAMFLGMFTDANVTVLLATFFISNHLFHAGALVFTVFSGAFLEQWVWYGAGYYLGNHQKFSEWAKKIVGRYDHHFHVRTVRSVVLSKFIYGLHRAALVRCGMLKIPPQQFLRASMVSLAVWIAVLSGLGFLFSASLQSIGRDVRIAGMVGLFFFAGLFIAEIFISRRLKKRL